MSETLGRAPNAAAASKDLPSWASAYAQLPSTISVVSAFSIGNFPQSPIGSATRVSHIDGCGAERFLSRKRLVTVKSTLGTEGRPPAFLGGLRVTGRGSATSLPKPLRSRGAEFFEARTVGCPRDALMFAHADGSPWGPCHQHRVMREASFHAEIQPAISFHILRHSYASFLTKGGVPLQVVASVLGPCRCANDREALRASRAVPRRSADSGQPAANGRSYP